MQNNPYKNRISEPLIKDIIRQASYALGDFRTDYNSRNHKIRNFERHPITNYIHNRLENNFCNQNITFDDFNRPSWTGRIYADNTNLVCYSFFTKNSFKSAYYKIHSNERRKSPHFSETLTVKLNNNVESFEQMDLNGHTPSIKPHFPIETYNKDYLTILSPSKCNDGYIYVPVVFEIRNNTLYDAQLVFLDKNVKRIKEYTISLKHLISPDFSDLTEPNYTNTTAGIVKNTNTSTLDSESSVTPLLSMKKAINNKK